MQVGTFDRLDAIHCRDVECRGVGSGHGICNDGIHGDGSCTCFGLTDEADSVQSSRWGNSSSVALAGMFGGDKSAGGYWTGLKCDQQAHSSIAKVSLMVVVSIFLLIASATMIAVALNRVRKKWQEK